MYIMMHIHTYVDTCIFVLNNAMLFSEFLWRLYTLIHWMLAVCWLILELKMHDVLCFLICFELAVSNSQICTVFMLWGDISNRTGPFCVSVRWISNFYLCDESCLTGFIKKYIVIFYHSRVHHCPQGQGWCLKTI